MALQRTHRPRVPKVQSGLGVGLPVQQHSGTGRSLRSLGAPLNARPLARLVVVFAVGLGSLPNSVSATAPTRTPTAAPRECAMVEAVSAADGHVESARILRSAGARFD